MSYTIPSEIQAAGGDFFESVGVFLVHVDRMYENMIGKDKPKYGITADLSIVEPADIAGQTANVNFFIGTDDDPGDLTNRVKPETFAARAGRLDKFCTAAGVDIRGANLEVALSDMQDRTLKGRTTAEKEPKVFQFGARKGQANENYMGRYNLNWTQWMKQDEGPAPVITTTRRKLAEADSNGSGGVQPGIQAPRPSTMTAPPPPPSPASRAPMPPRAGNR